MSDVKSILYGFALVFALLVLPVGVVLESFLVISMSDVAVRTHWEYLLGMGVLCVLVWGLFMIVVLSWRKLAEQQGRSSVPVAALKWNVLAILIVTGWVFLLPFVSVYVSLLLAALLFVGFVYFFHHKI